MTDFEKLVGMLTLQHRTVSENLKLVDEIEAHELWPHFSQNVPKALELHQNVRHEAEAVLSTIESMAAQVEAYAYQVQVNAELLRTILSRMNDMERIAAAQSTDVVGPN